MLEHKTQEHRERNRKRKDSIDNTAKKIANLSMLKYFLYRARH